MARLGNDSQLMQALNGQPTLLGTVVATTTKNNHDTAAPFSNTGEGLKGMTLMLQPDAACYVYFGPLNTQTATTSHVYLDAREKFTVTMKNSDSFVACVAITGTVNLRVFQVE